MGIIEHAACSTLSCDILQWKELPPLLQDLSIQNSDSLESLLEEGMLQSLFTHYNEIIIYKGV